MVVSFASTALRACAELTASIAKACDIWGLYSRKNLQLWTFNYNFME
jgi:hypothetical protein